MTINSAKDTKKRNFPLSSAPVNNVRIVISALWITVLFVFAYVDIFSLYRADFRGEIESGQISGFDINQSFLLATTLYIAVPSLMVVGSLLLPARISRTANIVLSLFYAVTITVGAIGEWGYYILGSIIEVFLLAAVVFYAWRWPRSESLTPPSNTYMPAEPHV
jgi:hypothetical protein